MIVMGNVSVVSETSVNELYPRVYATTWGDKVFVY